MPDLEQITFEIDASPAVSAQNQINAGMDATEKKIVGALGNANQAVQQHGDTVVGRRAADRNSGGGRHRQWTRI